MPMYEYVCDECGSVLTLSLRPAHPFSESHDNPETTMKCDGRFHRRWSAPAIGRVPGGGGSPSRGSS